MLSTVRNLGRGLNGNAVFRTSEMFAPAGSRTVMSEREIKMRMISVTNTRKITKAMKMVASAKLRQAETSMKESRPFVERVNSFFDKNFEIDADGGVPANEKKLMIIPMSSDKGLCGGINSFISKSTKLNIAQAESEGINNIKMICIGDKARGALHSSHGEKLVLSAGDFGKFSANFLQCSLVADRILEHDFDEAQVIFNHFVSLISYEQATITLFSPETLSTKITEITSVYEIEGEDEDTVVNNLAEFKLASTIFGCVKDGVAAEQSARVQAMENASKNAGEMITKLTLLYNRTRQASITTELIEIISGAESLKK
jgi:F-type H+-transporting ATPase subunit gamma